MNAFSQSTARKSVHLAAALAQAGSSDDDDDDGERRHSDPAFTTQKPTATHLAYMDDNNDDDDDDDDDDDIGGFTSPLTGHVPTSAMSPCQPSAELTSAAAPVRETYVPVETKKLTTDQLEHHPSVAQSDAEPEPVVASAPVVLPPVASTFPVMMPRTATRISSTTSSPETWEVSAIQASIKSAAAESRFGDLPALTAKLAEVQDLQAAIQAAAKESRFGDLPALTAKLAKLTETDQYKVKFRTKQAELFVAADTNGDGLLRL
jgi:hypothetical protein